MTTMFVQKQKGKGLPYRAPVGRTSTSMMFL